MKPCPRCGHRLMHHGPETVMPCGFVDQIVYCPKSGCGWSGLETREADGKEEPGPEQLALELGEDK